MVIVRMYGKIDLALFIFLIELVRNIYDEFGEGVDLVVLELERKNIIIDPLDLKTITF